MVGDDDLVDGEEAPLVVEEFGSATEHREFLKSIGDLPQGFRVGNADLTFTPAENPDMSDLPMRLTLMTLDQPTNSWTALFTKNVFPGTRTTVCCVTRGLARCVLISPQLTQSCLLSACH